VCMCYCVWVFVVLFLLSKFFRWIKLIIILMRCIGWSAVVINYSPGSIRLYVLVFSEWDAWNCGICKYHHCCVAFFSTFFLTGRPPFCLFARFHERARWPQDISATKFGRSEAGIKSTTSPQMCCHTTLRNLDVQLYSVQICGRVMHF